MRNGQPIGPFATLLSPDTPEASRKVVLELLDTTHVAKGELPSLAKTIRDWSTAKEPKDQ